MPRCKHPSLAVSPLAAQEAILTHVAASISAADLGFLHVEPV